MFTFKSIGIDELLVLFRALDLACYAQGPGRLVLSPAARVTPEIATAARQWKPALEWLCAHRLPPYPDRPLCEFWLTEMDWYVWLRVKDRLTAAGAPEQIREAS